jgi:hypothetical protein
MKNSIESKLFTEEMTVTIQNAVNKALLHHQAVGNKIAYWNEDRIVVEIPKKNQLRSINKTPNKTNDFG